MTARASICLTAALLSCALFAGTSFAAPKTRTEDEQHVKELTYLRKDIRIQAAKYLGENQVYSAMIPLGKVLQNDTEAEVRAMAAWALGECCAARAAIIIAKAAMDDPEETVRRDAVWALNYMEGARQDVRDSVIPALRWIALNDASPLVREKAAIVLGLIKPQGVATTLQQMFDKEPSVEVRARIARILGDIPGAKARQTLEKAAGDSSEMVVLEAKSALSRLAEASAVPDSDAPLKADAKKPVLEKKTPAKAPSKKIAPAKPKEDEVPELDLELPVQTTDYIALPGEIPDVDDNSGVTLVDKNDPPPAPEAKPVPPKRRKTAKKGASKASASKTPAAPQLPLPEEPPQQ